MHNSPTEYGVYYNHTATAIPQTNVFPLNFYPIQSCTAAEVQT